MSYWTRFCRGWYVLKADETVSVRRYCECEQSWCEQSWAVYEGEEVAEYRYYRTAAEAKDSALRFVANRVLAEYNIDRRL
jgi:hypothetical protein